MVSTTMTGVQGKNLDKVSYHRLSVRPKCQITAGIILTYYAGWQRGRGMQDIVKKGF